MSVSSSGVRRLEALTGEAARLWLTGREEQLRTVAATLKTTPDDVPSRVAALADQVRKLERELADAKKTLAMGGTGGAAPSGPELINNVPFLGQIVEALVEAAAGVLRAQMENEYDVVRVLKGCQIGGLEATDDGTHDALNVGKDATMVNMGISILRWATGRTMRLFEAHGSGRRSCRRDKIAGLGRRGRRVRDTDRAQRGSRLRGRSAPSL